MVVVYGRWRGSEVIKNMNQCERIPNFEICKQLVQIQILDLLLAMITRHRRRIETRKHRTRER